MEITMHGKRGKTIGCRFADTVKRCLCRKPCNSGLPTPLSKNVQNGRIKICKVTGDRIVCGRIAAMGVYPGVEADIISSGKGSLCILKVNGGTISFDTDVLDNIIVTSL